MPPSCVRWQLSEANPLRKLRLPCGCLIPAAKHWMLGVASGVLSPASLPQQRQVCATALVRLQGSTGELVLR
jgi:hypothetical protein